MCGTGDSKRACGPLRDLEEKLPVSENEVQGLGISSRTLIFS